MGQEITDLTDKLKTQKEQMQAKIDKLSKKAKGKDREIKKLK